MVETEHVGVETEAVERVVAIAIFDVAAHGVAHVGRVDAYLILAARLEPVFHQTVVGGAAEHMKVGDGILPAVVHGRRIGDVGLVVFQPVGDGAFVVVHLARNNRHIAAVVDHMMPVVFENLLYLLTLGVDHQAAGVAVEAVDHMGRTLLARLLEVVVKHFFHVERRVAGSHREDAHGLFQHHDVAVFIDQSHIAASECVVALVPAHADFHARFERIVEAGGLLAVHLDAAPLERSLDFRPALAFDVGEQPLQQRCLFVHTVVVVVVWGRSVHVFRS